MSLSVPSALLEKAQRGPVDEAEFVACVRDSLPYAWNVISGLVSRLNDDKEAEYADNHVPPPDEAARGQLLRLLASDSMRAAVERHFGVKLAFQNCHRVAVFEPEAAAGDTYREFVSPRGQLLNQSPEFVNC
ncbi:SCO5389 family protein [Bailinhaonella thermotolerans]|uniref:Uncharacterized protein n=1 Tax=Bailinhaonella thermotolerans TaxID=1070861 RepID=A0A3A4ACK5_9ACTN|nr:SCO5389 family protein [Bailinhaonella thermotolerans]RJL24517.1 hypothetical protein D5H75_29830 [Bailinhaonella thermotolerans]